MRGSRGDRRLGDNPDGGASNEYGRGAGGAAPGKRTMVQARGVRASQSLRDEEIQERAERGTSGSSGSLPFRSEIQASFGRHDVSHARAHTDSLAAESAASIGAAAFASGDRVAFAGSPDLFTAAHEAAHVVQQRGGVQLRGNVGQPGDAYERHADEVANKVVRGESAEALLDGFAGTGSGAGAPTVQRLVVYTDAIEQMDTVIAADLAYQHQRAGGATITLQQLASAEQDQIEIRIGETVVVTGHGEPGKVQGTPAEAIARLLLKVKNIDKAGCIYIASCDAATDVNQRQGTSCVDITHLVLGKKVKVTGAPGIAVTDFDRETGDHQTHYIPETQDLACAVEDLVIHVMRVHDIKKPKQFRSLEEAEEFGSHAIQDSLFRRFYSIFIKVLGGLEQHFMESLILHCDWVLELEDDSARDTWQTWLQGWRGVRRGGSDAAFLAYAKRTAADAKRGLQAMLDQRIPSLISRVDRGVLPLKGKDPGDDVAKPMRYDGTVGT